MELIPYQQCRGAAQARRLTGARARAFLDGIAARSATIEKAHVFQAEWAAFCAAQRSWYMARLAAISRVDQVLWQRRLLPQSLLRRRAANWLGLLGSPSHLAVLLGALDELMRGRRT